MVLPDADWGARSYVTRAVRNTFDLFGVLSGPRREVLRGRQVPVKPRLLEPETLGPAERKRARKHVLRARGTCVCGAFPNPAAPRFTRNAPVTVVRAVAT